MQNSQLYCQTISIAFAYEAHGTLGGMSTESRGGNFWQGFASGAAASLVSGTVAGVFGLPRLQVPEVWTKTAMIAAGGLAGGVSSSIAGGEFIDGLCNGLICAGLNHALHWVADGGGRPFKRWLKDYPNRYKHHWQTDRINPEGRCKAAMAANIGQYFGAKRGDESYYWGLFESHYGVDHNVTLEEYFVECGFDFYIIGKNQIEKAVDLLPEGNLIVFQMKSSGRYSSHVVALTGAVRENIESEAMFRISDPMNIKVHWEPYNNAFHNSIEKVFIIRGLK